MRHEIEIWYSVAIVTGMRGLSRTSKMSIANVQSCIGTELVDSGKTVDKMKSLRFLMMILFMVFVLSYERCNNNSCTAHTTHAMDRKRYIDSVTRTSVHTTYIYLKFSSFDLAISHKF